MYKLILSVEAEQDLEAIYINGYQKWGEEQADQYYDALLAHFDVLCENPYLFRAVDEIRIGYRRSVCGKHSVFYRISEDTVEIMGLVRSENRFPVD
jgi:toxin ParE1/3/4